MSNLKYELLETSTGGLRRIKALRDFGDVKKGDLGGLIESEENLSHEGSCWVYGHAKVFGDARVYDNAKVSGYAWVSGYAEVYGYAEVSGDAWVYGYAEVYGDARVSGDAWVSGDAKVSGIEEKGIEAPTSDEQELRSRVEREIALKHTVAHLTDAIEAHSSNPKDWSVPLMEALYLIRKEQKA